MSTTRLLALVLSLLLLQLGCISPPPREDSLGANRGVYRGMARFPDQSVTVVLSPRTQNALEFLAVKARKTGSSKDVSAAKDVVVNLKRVLAANFRSFQVVTNAAEARGPSDLTMVLDMRVTLARMSWQQNSIELQGSLVGPDQQPYATVTGSGTSTMPWPAFQTEFFQAADAAFIEFNNNLRALPGEKLNNRGSAMDSPRGLPVSPGL